MRAEFRREHVRADIFEETPLGDDVANVRDVVKRDCLGGEDRRGHAGQGRVLGAADRDATIDGIAAANAKFFHVRRLKEKLEIRECAGCG